MSIYDITQNIFYANVSDAILGSNAGDVIQISAGTYAEDFPKIKHDLTVQGVGGLAHFTPIAGQQPSNGMAILVTDANVTLDHLELSGATVPAGNGAGVRQETGNLVITNSWLHDNENGLLTSALLPGATLTIDHSEFSGNGTSSGFTHNLYVGQIGTLTVTNSYFTAVDTGHEIKSRADVSNISSNRIQDGPGGTGSYSIDLPNGGIANISGNVIEKGVNAQNWTFIAYGEEVSSLLSTASLDITSNVVINHLPAGAYGPFVWDVAGLLPGNPQVLPAVTGNTFYGLVPAQTVAGPGNGDFLPGGSYALTNTYLAISQAPPLDTSQPFAVPEPAMTPLLMLAVATVATIRRLKRRGAAGAAG